MHDGQDNNHLIKVEAAKRPCCYSVILAVKRHTYYMRCERELQGLKRPKGYVITVLGHTLSQNGILVRSTVSSISTTLLLYCILYRLSYVSSSDIS